jgi:hypothetical protein
MTNLTTDFKVRLGTSVVDPDPGSDPKQDLYLTKIIQKISNLLIMILKIH